MFMEKSFLTRLLALGFGYLLLLIIGTIYLIKSESYLFLLIFYAKSAVIIALLTFITFSQIKSKKIIIETSATPSAVNIGSIDSPTVKAKYLALQTQINPHFLYNTLEGFRSEALLSGIPTVAKMSELLAKFFRYNISNLEKMVTIEDELKNIQNYFRIQQFRFDDRLNLEIIFEDDEELIKNCPTPKLILQPIVENAIHHGIEPLLEQGKVTIRFAVYADNLIITISDNGVGMNKDALMRLNKKIKHADFEMVAKTSSSSGIGVLNVNKRIQLLFGENYGLLFFSKLGIGTDVEISLPTKGGNGLNEANSTEI